MRPRSGSASDFECGRDAVVGLGTNLGEREATLQWAVLELGALGQVVAVSSVYETPPLGPPQPDYLNAAVRLRTELEPDELLAKLLEIERAAGRQRRERWGPRTLDLDILWMGDRVVQSETLSVPHAALGERAFALVPLLEVAPEATDPRTGVAYREQLARLGPLGIRRTPQELAKPAPSPVDTPLA